nr:retrovirus-related Pol polyprotein from transposon TNT 1-94 [Tanacetum cinerariifolium]
MSSYNHFGCSWCGGPFNGGNCPGCSSVGSGNEFVYDPNPYSYDETPNFFNQPPEHQYETYSCELCGDSPHYGFDCQTRTPLVYEQDPVIAKEHVVISVLDDEETLILEEESRSKMLDKQNDPISIEKKIKVSPIDYLKLNKIKEDFEKCFVTQKKLPTEQAFWLKHLSLSLRHIHLLESKILVNFLRTDNDQLLNQIMSQEIVHIIVNSVDILDVKNSCVNDCRMFKLNIEPISPRLKNNMDAHEVYIKKTIEYADILCGFVKRARIHEKLVAVTPINKDKRVRFIEPVTSSSNIPKQTDSFQTKDSNKPLLTSTRVKPTTSASGSKPSCNIKNNRITQPPHRNQKNKVEDHPRKVKSSLNKTNFVSEPISNARVKHFVVQIDLWYLDSKCSKHMTWNRSQLMNFVSKFLRTVRFENDEVAKIMGYGDYQQGNVIISRVYYVEGLRRNLFSVRQFYDTDLKVEFQKNTCFIRNLEGVDLLLGSQDTNVYTISLDDMLKTSPICLLSKASETKSWLRHRRLSHLNFDTLNKLAKDGLARGILKLKFQKGHLCSACALGKSKKSSHQPKAEDTNQKKLYLLQMNL